MAIGRDGQNVRLAAKLTGWKIDIQTPEGREVSLDEKEELKEELKEESKEESKEKETQEQAEKETA